MKPRAISPWLVDMTRYTLPHPSPEQVDAVTLHTRVKVIVALAGSVFAETIWLEVAMRCKHYWLGQNKTKMQFSEAIRVGDLVKFHPCNVLDIAPAIDE